MVVRNRPGSLFASDEELGKRDDDHKPKQMGTWNVKHRPTWRKRRVLGAVAACFFVWLFIHYIPTDMGPRFRQMPYSPNSPHYAPGQRAVPNPERRRIWDELQHDEEDVQDEAPDHPHPPPAKSNPAEVPGKEYDGAIKFYHLASTLRAAAAKMPFGAESTNVLFAASDLVSASALIPLACEMASWKRNTVHMAIMGKSDLDQEEIHRMNGVTDETCDIAWHDARPDYAPVSSERRLEISVAGAMGHIMQFLSPVAVVTTDLDHEDTFFSQGLQRKTKETWLTHIQVPRASPSVLRWLARLDSTSLRSWHAASFDILIQAPLGSSGSLIRLLKSLAAADYRGFNPPRLVIELPHEIDKATKNYLAGFQWPPMQYYIPGQNEQLTIRRRITEQRADVAEASLRFIESFYPSSPAGPHVLLLSPQMELSPVFFHYLKLHLLELKHSAYPSPYSQDLFGISLEAPSNYLNGSKFSALSVQPTKSAASLEDSDKRSFRWQAPNGNAALYFADKWIEAHSFLTRRNSAAMRSSTKEYFQDLAKMVSSKSPAWVEFFLEVMRARGWVLHYPSPDLDSSSSESEVLAIAHNELYQLPEEFVGEAKKTTTTENPSDESVLTVKNDYLAAHHPGTDSPSSPNFEGPLRKDMASLLSAPPPPPNPLKEEKERPDETDSDYGMPWSRQSKGPPPFAPLDRLPLLNYLGLQMDVGDLERSAKEVRIDFRRQAGGCSEAYALSKESEREPLNAEDLFCLDDVDLSSASPPLSPDIRVEPNVESTTRNEESTSRNQDAAAVLDRTEDDETDNKPGNDPTNLDPTSAASQLIHGGGGVAAGIDRVVDAERYQETAAAGFKKKLEAMGKASPPSPDAENDDSKPKFPTIDLDHPALNPDATARKTREELLTQVRPKDETEDEFMRLAAPVLPNKGRKQASMGKIPVRTENDPEI